MGEAQKKWNKKHPDKIQEYETSRRNRYKEIRVRLHKEDDRDLIEAIEALDCSVTDFGKSAFKEEILRRETKKTAM